MSFTLKGPGLHHVSSIESVFGGKSVCSCKIFLLLRYIVRTNLKKERKKKKKCKDHKEEEKSEKKSTERKQRNND